MSFVKLDEYLIPMYNVEYIKYDNSDKTVTIQTKTYIPTYSTLDVQDFISQNPWYADFIKDEVTNQ